MTFEPVSLVQQHNRIDFPPRSLSQQPLCMRPKVCLPLTIIGIKNLAIEATHHQQPNIHLEIFNQQSKQPAAKQAFDTTYRKKTKWCQVVGGGSEVSQAHAVATKLRILL